ncbi:hypothetical protein MO867_01005 [Microbulbifer sp. OS29]|uniref:Uncharacterized protein n=1 Tax=Microbulbifer okhotskensis TaxID=2926617 RepID=A0A9X2EJR5_9GAMM|nr:hypothetical protein [Microbulbifer okhotskensis]MCO1332905.1 hypothetical protein [Microbulbifer okhotskensis]
MAPVAAVLTVFALILGAIAWLRLLLVGFARDPLSGLIALFLPPLALLLLIPQRHEEGEIFILAGAACFCLVTACTLR